jgi:hypothetical protein
MKRRSRATTRKEAEGKTLRLISKEKEPEK